MADNDARLAAVVAPPGWGKTALLAAVAARAGPACTALRLGGPGVDQRSLTVRVEHAIASADTLHRRAFLLVDGIDRVPASPSSPRVLSGLLHRLPANVRVVVSARQHAVVEGSFDTVAGDVIRIGPTDLAFTALEISQLLGLAPDEVDDVVRSTEGWPLAVGLLERALTRQPAVAPAELARTLHVVPGVAALLQARALDRVPAPLRDFLVRTSPLHRLVPAVCDGLLGRTDSSAMVRDLVDLGVVDDGAAPRLPAVLRNALQTELDDATGGRAAVMHRRAGVALEAVGEVGWAVAAYWRAGAHDAVTRLLATAGDQAAAWPAPWLDVTPPAEPASPWADVARARRHLAAGLHHDALAAYRRTGAVATLEWTSLEGWLSRDGDLPPGPVAMLREACRRAPGTRLASPSSADDVGAVLVNGLALVFAGRLDEGCDLLGRAAATAPGTPLGIGASVLAGTIRFLIGTDGDGRGIERAVAAADAAGLGWISRTWRPLLMAAGGSSTIDEIADVVRACERAGDRWGAGLGAWLGGMAALVGGRSRAGAAVALLDDASRRFRDLRADALHVWAESAAAVAGCIDDQEDAVDRALRARHLAVALEVPGAEARAAAALASTGGPRRHEHAARVRQLTAECGTGLGRLAEQVLRSTHESGSAGGETATTLVGRRRELGRLVTMFEAAAARRGGLVRVVGEAGVGKTILVEHLARQARGTGARVCWTRATPGMPASGLWKRAVRDLVDGLDDDTIQRALGLAAGDVVSLLHDGTWEPSRRERFGTGLARLLRWSAQQRPLVLVVDDLEHADGADVRLVGDLQRELADEPLLLIAVYRDEEIAPSIAGVFDDLRAAPVIRVGGLRGTDLAAFVADELGSDPDTELLDRIDAASGGNPTFVREVMAELLERGEPSSPPSVAPGLRRLVDGRVATLTRRDADVVRAAAVLGDRIDPDVLAAAMGVAGTALTAPLEHAGVARLLVRRGDQEWAFAGPAVRELLARQVDEPTRLLLHRGAASYLESAARVGRTTRAVDLAHHLLSGGVRDEQRVAAAVVAASGEAIAAGAPAAAATLCERGLDVIGAAPSTARAAVMFELARVRSLLAEPGTARRLFRDAAVFAGAAGDAPLAARAALGYAGAWGDAPPDDFARRLLEDSKRALTDGGGALLARVEARLATALPATPEHVGRRRALSAAAYQRAMFSGDSASIAAALTARTWTEASPGPQRIRDATVAELVEHAERSGDAEALVRALRLRHHVALEHGDIAVAEAAVGAIARLLDDHAVAGGGWHLGVVRACHALLDGRNVDAGTLAAGAVVTAGGETESVEAAQHFTAQMFLRSREIGRLAGFESRLRVTTEQQPAAAVWRAARAFLLMETGRTADARTEIDRFAAQGIAALPPDRDRVATLFLLGEVVADLGDRSLAATLHAELLPWRDRVAVLAVGAAVLGSVEKVLGRLAAVAGLDDAEACFERAIGIESRLGSGPLVARTRLAYARWLLGSGDVETVARGRELAVAANTAAVTYGLPAITLAPDAAAPAVAAALPDPRRGDRRKVMLRCLGPYALEVDGVAVDLTAVKPRHRSLLWLLSIHAGEAVHSDAILEALWPDAPEGPGRRNLQVAVSSLRHAIEPDAPRGQWDLLVREGDAYRLAVDDHDDVDICRFDQLLAEARVLRDEQPHEAVGRYTDALTLWRGDLIPEAGAADWIVLDRDARRLEAADAAIAAAGLHLGLGRPAAAKAVCERGLSVDRYRDALWRLLIESCEAEGDQAGAALARRAYDAVLSELGVVDVRS